MIDFSNIENPIVYDKMNICHKLRIQKNVRKLFINTYLNVINRKRMADYVITNKDTLDKNINVTQILSNAVVLVPISNTGNYTNVHGYSVNERRYVLDILRATGIFNIKLGEWHGKDSPRNFLTTVSYKKSIKYLNEDFIAFLKSKYSKEKFQAKLFLLIKLHSELGFYQLFNKYDWLNLSFLDSKKYNKLQDTIEYKKEMKDLDSKAKIYIGSKENKSTEKLNNNNFIHLEKESKEISDINKMLPKGLEDLKYKRTLLSYSDMNSCRKNYLNESELGTDFGGRLSSFFNYGIKKDVRNWFMNIIDYKEVDMSAMLFNTLYFYETGKFHTERIYNKIAKYILLNKKSLKHLSNEDLIFATSILANKIKQSVILTYNVDGKDFTKKTINKQLRLKGLDTNFKSEMLEEFPDCDIKLKSIELGFIDSKTRKGNWPLIQNYTVNKRNINFLERNGITEENRRFLEILGNHRITASEIMYSLEKNVPELRQYMYRGNSLETQFIESQALISITKEMKHDHIIPFLVHDGFYVPEKYVEKYDKLFHIATAKATINYKSNKLEDLYNLDMTNSPELFINTIEKLYNINKTKYNTKETFLKEQKNFSYITSSVIGNNTKRRKSLFPYTIWNNSDFDIIEKGNISDLDLKSLKFKILDYLHTSNNFSISSFLVSLYLFSMYNNTYLLYKSDFSMKEVIISDFLSQSKSDNNRSQYNLNNNFIKNDINTLVTLMINTEKYKYRNKESLNRKVKLKINNIKVKIKNLKRKNTTINTDYLEEQHRYRVILDSGG